ncbi:MBL fold metallo-hydrolase [Haladaptatus sp. DYSN1]|uniref:MBL fold metallo-hydrolase n=1 Tax=unclassified Haladaptatus TaxID=2622732 RepID=UPI002406BBF6|nr:MBL fold metallo-hydrolase [Haladaptatus sp. DYSN1]
MDPVACIPVSVATYAPEGATNAYVVGTNGAILIDPAARSDDLDREVEKRSVEHVLVTHTHPDHVGAVAAYAEECGATVWARRGRETTFEQATSIAPDHTFVEGTTLTTQSRDEVTVLDTPGHARDHVALATDHGIFSGDLAVQEGSVVVAAGEGDVRAYLTALRRLAARNPPRLYPGHGLIIENVRETCERLIRHRLDREKRVLAAVREGATTLDAITDAAYDKDISAVRSLAEGTVAAHLEKLDVEHKLSWDGTRATPR